MPPFRARPLGSLTQGLRRWAALLFGLFRPLTVAVSLEQ